MTGEAGEAGEAWPEALHGEVFSPTGRRAYLTLTVSEALGKSQRWAAGLAKRADPKRRVEAERGHALGKRGPECIFLIAESFEKVGSAEKWWPPPDSSPDASSPPSDWATLFKMQGEDLEAARERIAELESEMADLRETDREQVKRIERLQRDKDELLEVVARLSRVARIADSD